MLASNPIVVCGSAHVSWSHFSCAILFLEYIRFGRTRPFSQLRFMAAICCVDWVLCFCLGAKSSSHAMVLPIDPILATWKKLILSRSRLLTTEQEQPDGTHTNIPKSLLRYQLFVHQAFRRSRVFSIGLKILVIIGLVVGLVVYLVVYLVAIGVISLESKADKELCESEHQNHDQDWIYQGICEARTTVLDVSQIVIIVIFCVLFTAQTWLVVKSILNQRQSTKEFDAMHKLAIDEDRFDDLVHALINRGSRDPKDKAFGIHSILEKRRNAKLLTPDYTISQGQIFKDLTINIILGTGSLKPLVLAAIRRLPGYPTWIPDWSARFDQLWEPSFLTIPSHMGVTPGSEPFSRLYLHKNTLLVHGRSLCSVTELVRLQSLSRNFRESERAMHIENILAIKKLSPPLLTVLFYYLMNLSPKGLLNINVYPKLFNEYRQFILSYRDAPASEFLNHLLRSHIDYRAHFEICNGFARTERQIFITTDISIPGRFALRTDQLGPVQGSWKNPAISPESPASIRPSTIGICSTTTQVGDKVCLFEGISIPVIVRHENGRWQLISPTVLPQIISGGAWIRQKEEEANLEEFELC